MLTLALGIGANTAIFSVVKGVLLNSLPYPQSDRLVKLAANDSETLNPTTVSYGLVQDWKQRTNVFSAIGMYRDFQPAITGQDKPQMIVGLRASVDYYEALGAHPILGRSFTRDDDRPDRWHVVPLSYGFWQSYFGGRADVVGQKLPLNTTTFEIVGVLPRDFVPVTRAWNASESANLRATRIRLVASIRLSQLPTSANCRAAPRWRHARAGAPGNERSRHQTRARILK